MSSSFFYAAHSAAAAAATVFGVQRVFLRNASKWCTPSVYVLLADEKPNTLLLCRPPAGDSHSPTTAYAEGPATGAAKM